MAMKPRTRIAAGAMTAAMLCTMTQGVTAFAEVAGETMTAVITLNGDTITATGANVTVTGNVATITASGSYEIVGTLTDGQICVNVPDETVDPETVKLFLNGVTMTGVSEAPIYVVNAENTSINLVAGTENYLYDGPLYTNTEAVIFAKDDLTIKGEGSLFIEASTYYGVHCNNDLKVTGGNIKVDTMLEDGLRGKTSVEIKGGTLNINAEGDGIKSTQGDVMISGGEMEVKAGNDAIQGETSLQIIGGTVMANGDRGLTCALAVASISGGTVLATATDFQPTSLDAVQPVMELNFAAEWLKDQHIIVTKDGVTEFDMKPDKKFSYALISYPTLTVGATYGVSIDAQTLTQGATADTAFAMTDAMTLFTDVAASAEIVVADGDINGDGVVTVADAVLLNRYIAEDTQITVTDEMTNRMDLNSDGSINVQDTQAVISMIAGTSV